MFASSCNEMVSSSRRSPGQARRVLPCRLFRARGADSGTSPFRRAGAVAVALSVFGPVVLPAPANAFGDTGHRVIALVAWEHLSPAARDAAAKLLDADPDAYRMRDGGSTADAFDRQATWPDYFRDAQRRGGAAPQAIHSYTWHFANVRLSDASLERACAGFPALAPGVAASRGPNPDCIVNKVEQFAAALASPATGVDEKRRALKFLMHLVGDLHQPLHVADDDDRGGNDKRARVGDGEPRPLHFHWDVTFVDRIADPGGHGAPAAAEVRAALPAPGAELLAEWRRAPDPRRWAMETFALGREVAYGALPAPDADVRGPAWKLDRAYVERAVRATATQLAKAGVRLADLLERALAPR